MSEEEERKKVPIKKEGITAPGRPTPLDMFEAFDDLLEDFRRTFRSFVRPWKPWRWSALERFMPELPTREAYADIIDTGKEFHVCVEMPGIPKDKIDITVTKDGIEIFAETEAEKEEKEKNFIHRERSYSRIYKKLTFPEEVIPEEAEATLKNGLLEVRIPKKVPKEVKKYKVEIK
ncbi:MAG: Hsp20/alpha crystallin family protein [Nitrososphaerota archaeon]|nr:Hsp20/alpha crystallin family protein [Nitrososphaerales archaeon]MDW8044335.1 Hsp20/alpha crystallin family protein [Nitrososphaerota archaeon]